MSTRTEQGTDAPVRVLRLPQVLARTGLSRSSIYLRVADGTFPRPVRLGKRAIGWIESEIDQWIRAQIAASRGGA
ncbi:MAG: AlpA family transcriptional regulator [Gemmatimonadota bacterium]|nr:AlpA family transcriptional regulator [Gemmatimonadota bacterium]